MKIEHWRPKSRFPDQQLVYANLLAACLGGQGPRDLHCDTLKGDRDLKYNPANSLPRIESLISYRSDGTICSQNADFSGQLDEILGLNISELGTSRTLVLDAILTWWKIEKHKRKGSVPREVFERKRDKLLSQTHGNLKPFVQVQVWWLEEQLARRTARPSSSLATRRSRP